MKQKKILNILLFLILFSATSFAQTEKFHPVKAAYRPTALRSHF